MVQLDTKAGCVMGSDDSEQIHDVKYPKWKYYKDW